DISKAINVNEQFQVSLQFWSYLIENNLLKNPEDFIMPLPHMSMVQGEDNIDYLKRRFEAMRENPLFETMEFSDDVETLKEWIPLMMENRDVNDKIAATKVKNGTDVNFGNLTRMLIQHLEEQNVDMHYNHDVTNLKRTPEGLWEVKVKNEET